MIAENGMIRSVSMPVAVRQRLDPHERLVVLAVQLKVLDQQVPVLAQVFIAVVFAVMH